MNFVESHVECPCGKSSDAYCVNEDGSGKCFSCGKFFKASSEDNWNNIVEWGLMEKNKTFNQKQVVDKTPLDTEVEFKYVEHRGIYASTYQYFEASAKIDKQSKNLIEIGFIYPNRAAKIRQVYPKKGFFVKGDMKSATLFGKNKFDAGALKTITIVEGELDVLSSWQMLGGNSAVVTPRSASSARVDCKAEWEYINAFDKIILCFDNDEPGQKAAQEVASLFDFNKVFKVELTRHKDPTGYLEAGEIKEFNLAWHGAKRFTPDNIISTFSEIAKSLEESEDDLLGTYPFSGLQSALYGLYRGEVVVFKGDEGIGKSETLKAIEHHLLKENKDNKLMLIHLEEPQSRTIKAIATYEDKYPYVHPQSQADNKSVFEAFKRAVDNNESRVYIYKSFDLEDEHKFIDNIRFAVSAGGCQFVFLDHITWLATGIADEDERKKLDRISQRLKLLAEELGFCLIMVSHTNDDGKTRGSRNISKVANTVVHMHRDKVSQSEEERNVMYYTIEKARAGGNTGPGGFAIFDKETMRLLDSESVSF